MNELSPFELYEDTAVEIVDKIQALAWRIQEDWSDPRSECRKIVELSDKLKTLL